MTSQQLADATGLFELAFRKESGTSITSDTLFVPSYMDIQRQLNGDSNGTLLANPTIEGTASKLRQIKAARAIVAYAVSGTKQYSPGIVLPDGRIGILHNQVDTTTDIKELSTLTDLQQLLLAGVYTRQQEAFGKTHNRGIAEIGHATLIGVSRQPDKIHDTVHDFADTKAFATKVSSLTTIHEGHKTRPTGALVVPVHEVLSIAFLPDHQSPLPVGSFEASAGFALAAARTQARPIDVDQNVMYMANQMGPK